MKKNFYWLGVIILLLAIFVFWRLEAPQNSSGIHGTVTTSFYPIYEFTSRVAGSDISVINISGNNVSPHDYEPSAQDIIRIEKSCLLIFNGAGLDPWAERLTHDLEEKGVSVLELASHVTLLDATGHEEGEEHEHGDKDPHFWVDPVNAKQEVIAIRDALIRIDPEHESGYTQRAADYLEELQALDQDIRDGLSACEKDTIVVSHNAFQYFAQRYGIQTLSLAGLSPTNEPSVQQLTEITDTVRKLGIQYIFFETLVSSRLSDILASEVGATTLVLDPVAGISEAEQARGASYISVMQKNLSNIQQALQCQSQ